MDNGNINVIDNITPMPIEEIEPSKLEYNKKLRSMLGGDVFSITRDSNLDGIGSASFLVRELNIKPRNMIFTQQTEFDSLLKRLQKAKFENAAFIITDMNANYAQIGEIRKIIALIKSRKSILIWLDHHPWKKEAVDAIKKNADFVIYGENPMYSAAQLLYVLLCARTAVNKELSDLIHVSDFALDSKKYTKISERLNFAIVAARRTKSKDKNLAVITKLIAENDFNNKFIKKYYDIYASEMDKNIKKLLATSVMILNSRYKVAVGFSKRLHTNMACTAIRKQFNSDISVYVDTETGKSGLRSSEGVDCSILASALGGGGHPQASGFVVKPASYSKFGEKGMKKFEKYLTKLVRESYD